MNEPVQATVEMAKQPGIISMQDAIKAATETIGDYVISASLFTGMGEVSYYQISVVGPANEVKDVYVGARSGKVRQVIEHPEEMPPRPLRVERARTLPLHCSRKVLVEALFFGQEKVRFGVCEPRLIEESGAFREVNATEVESFSKPRFPVNLVGVISGKDSLSDGRLCRISKLLNPLM